MASAVRYRLDLEYDGSGFEGWQSQPRGRTVQGVVEAVLSTLACAPVRVTGAGRTDRGCHATRQVAHFDLDARYDSRTVRRALASMLPADTRLLGLWPVPAAFHARYAALARHYVYLIVDRPSVFLNRYAWRVGEALDISRMQRAAAALIGTHDFRHFAVRGSDTVTTVCTVRRANWDRWRLGYRFRIEADRFLRRMVRMLVGAMVPVGRGEATPRAVASQLAGSQVAPPAAAPAHGLYLAGVSYTRAPWSKQ